MSASASSKKRGSKNKKVEVPESKKRAKTDSVKSPSAAGAGDRTTSADDSDSTGPFRVLTIHTESYDSMTLKKTDKTNTAYMFAADTPTFDYINQQLQIEQDEAKNSDLPNSFSFEWKTGSTGCSAADATALLPSDYPAAQTTAVMSLKKLKARKPKNLPLSHIFPQLISYVDYPKSITAAADETGVDHRCSYGGTCTVYSEKGEPFDWWRVANGREHVVQLLQNQENKKQFFVFTDQRKEGAGGIGPNVADPLTLKDAKAAYTQQCEFWDHVITVEGKKKK